MIRDIHRLSKLTNRIQPIRNYFLWRPSMNRYTFQQQISGVLLVLASVFGMHGCSSSDAPPSTEVSGVATISGTPIAKGSIVFAPADGKGPTAGGKIVDGKFQFQSPLGEKRVEIYSPRVIGKAKDYDTPDSPVRDVVEEGVAPLFNSDSTLKTSVTANSKESFSFDVKPSKPSAKK